MAFKYKGCFTSKRNNNFDQVETMTNLGDVTAISNMELSDLVPEGEAYTAGQQEIGNLAPQDFIENST